MQKTHFILLIPQLLIGVLSDFPCPDFSTKNSPAQAFYTIFENFNDIFKLTSNKHLKLINFETFEKETTILFSNSTNNPRQITYYGLSLAFDESTMNQKIKKFIQTTDVNDLVILKRLSLSAFGVYDCPDIFLNFDVLYSKHVKSLCEIDLSNKNQAQNLTNNPIVINSTEKVNKNANMNVNINLTEVDVNKRDDSLYLSIPKLINDRIVFESKQNNIQKSLEVDKNKLISTSLIDQKIESIDNRVSSFEIGFPEKMIQNQENNKQKLKNEKEINFGVIQSPFLSSNIIKTDVKEAILSIPNQQKKDIPFEQKNKLNSNLDLSQSFVEKTSKINDFPINLPLKNEIDKKEIKINDQKKDPSENLPTASFFNAPSSVLSTIKNEKSVQSSKNDSKSILNTKSNKPQEFVRINYNRRDDIGSHDIIHDQNEQSNDNILNQQDQQIDLNDNENFKEDEFSKENIENLQNESLNLNTNQVLFDESGIYSPSENQKQEKSYLNFNVESNSKPKDNIINNDNQHEETTIRLIPNKNDFQKKSQKELMENKNVILIVKLITDFKSCPKTTQSQTLNSKTNKKVLLTNIQTSSKIPELSKVIKIEDLIFVLKGIVSWVDICTLNSNLFKMRENEFIPMFKFLPDFSKIILDERQFNEFSEWSTLTEFSAKKIEIGSAYLMNPAQNSYMQNLDKTNNLLNNRFLNKNIEHRIQNNVQNSMFLINKLEESPTMIVSERNDPFLMNNAKMIEKNENGPFLENPFLINKIGSNIIKVENDKIEDGFVQFFNNKLKNNNSEENEKINLKKDNILSKIGVKEENAFQLFKNPEKSVLNTFGIQNYTDNVSSKNTISILNDEIPDQKNNNLLNPQKSEVLVNKILDEKTVQADKYIIKPPIQLNNESSSQILTDSTIKQKSEVNPKKVGNEYLHIEPILSQSDNLGDSSIILSDKDKMNT